MVDYLPGSSTSPADFRSLLTGAVALGADGENRLRPAQDDATTTQRHRGALVLAGKQQAPEGMVEMDLKGAGSPSSPLISARLGGRVHLEHTVKSHIAAL